MKYKIQVIETIDYTYENRYEVDIEANSEEKARSKAEDAINDMSPIEEKALGGHPIDTKSTVLEN